MGGRLGDRSTCRYTCEIICQILKGREFYFYQALTMPSLLLLSLLAQGLILAQFQYSVAAQFCSPVMRSDVIQLLSEDTLQAYDIFEGDESIKTLCVSHGDQLGELTYTTVAARVNVSEDGGFFPNQTVLVTGLCNPSTLLWTLGGSVRNSDSSAFALQLREDCYQCGTLPICQGLILWIIIVTLYMYTEACI